MKNQNIEEVYIKPDFEVVKGLNFKLCVQVDKMLEQFYHEHLFDMIDHWTFPYDNQYVRPFRVKEYKIEDNHFEFILIVKKQISELDMLKLMSEDLIFAFNYAGYLIINWKYSL